MTAKSISKFIGGSLGLTLVHVVVVIITAMFIGVVEADGADSAEQAGAFIGFLAMCGINAVMLMALAQKSHYDGLKLGLWLAILYFMIAPFMSLIESAFFDIGIDTPTTIKLMVSQAIGIFIVALLAPTFAGKRKASAEQTLQLPAINKGTMPTLLVGSLAYLVVYWLFGYYIPWQEEVVRQFYGAQELLPFIEHTWVSVTEAPSLMLFQLLRGVIWMLIAGFLIEGLNGRGKSAYLLTGFAFALLMGSGLLVDNPYMPEAVRIAHLKEVMSSNFVYGILAVWLWHRGKTA